MIQEKDWFLTYNVFKDLLFPIGYIFEWSPVYGTAVDLTTPKKVHDYFGFGTWRLYSPGTFSKCAELEKDYYADRYIQHGNGIYGNIDLYNRQRLYWSEANIERFSSQLASWGIHPEIGSYSTVLGGSNEYSGVEIAYSPLEQTSSGPVLLSRSELDSYIVGLVQGLNEGWTESDLLAVDNRKLIAAVGEDAIRVGESMHSESESIEAAKDNGETGGSGSGETGGSGSGETGGSGSGETGGSGSGETGGSGSGGNSELPELDYSPTTEERIYAINDGSKWHYVRFGATASPHSLEHAPQDGGTFDGKSLSRYTQESGMNEVQTIYARFSVGGGSGGNQNEYDTNSGEYTEDRVYEHKQLDLGQYWAELNRLSDKHDELSSIIIALINSLKNSGDEEAFNSMTEELMNQNGINEEFFDRLTELDRKIDGLNSTKQNKLTFDDRPLNGSTNPVKSGGILEATIEATAHKFIYRWRRVA